MHLSLTLLQFFKIIAIVIGSLILLRLLRKLLGRFSAKTVMTKVGVKAAARNYQRAETLTNVFINVIGAIVVIISIMMILTELKINITPLLASAGIIGLAIGLGAQTVVRDLINGISLLAEDQLGHGDLVRINGFEGKVEQMSLRSVFLRDLDGTVHIIPNNRINEVSNYSREYSQVNVNLPFDRQVPVDQAQKMIKAALEVLTSTKRSAEMIIRAPQILGVEDYSLNQYNIKVVIKTQPLKQFEVKRRLLHLMLKELEKYVQTEKKV